MMKQWAIRIFIALTVLFVLAAGALFIFVKTTLNETSIALLEEKISKILGDNSVDFIAVASSDEKKGEKIVLLISNITLEFKDALKQKIIKGFDNKLMIPEIIKIVDEIPKLGSGKKDYLKAKEFLNNLEELKI